MKWHPKMNRLGPGTVLLVSGVFAEYPDQRFCVPPTTPPMLGRKMPNWRVVPCLVKQGGTGFPVLSRCLAAQGVDRLSTQVLGGESLAVKPEKPLSCCRAVIMSWNLLSRELSMFSHLFARPKPKLVVVVGVGCLNCLPDGSIASSVPRS